MEDNKFQELELWHIVAFYMAKADNKGFRVKTLVDKLHKAIIIIKPYYKDKSIGDIKNKITDDVLRDRSIFKEDKYVWKLTESGLNNGLKWAKEDPDNILKYYEELMEFCENQTIEKVNNKKTENISKQEYFQDNKVEKLKIKIIEQCKKYSIYLLGQLEFDPLEYRTLKQYAKKCIKTSEFGSRNDIVLITAIVKIAQRNATNWQDIWIKIGKVLGVKTKTKIKIKGKFFTFQDRIEKIFQDTILFYNSVHKLDLYIDNTKKQPENIASHCYIFDTTDETKKIDKTKQYFEVIKTCYDWNDNLTVEHVRQKLIKSDFSKNLKDVLCSEYSKVERLLKPQIEYIKTRNEDLIKKDHFVKKLSKYLNGNLDTEQYNLLILNDRKEKSKEPFLKITKDYEISVFIPRQRDCKSEIDVSIETSNGTKIAEEYEVDLYEESLNLQISREYYKYIFDTLIIKIGEDISYDITQKFYRFFGRNDKEYEKLSSINKNPAVVILKDNIDISGNKIKEVECGDGYRIYLVSLKDKTGHIILDNKIHYVSDIKKSDLELDCSQVSEIELQQNIKYSTTLPNILIRNNVDMKNAHLKVIDLTSANQDELEIEISTGAIKDSEDNESFYIFDLENYKVKSFFNVNHIYKVEYTNKNTSINDKFILIEDIKLKFEKELYFNEDEIILSINKSFKLTNVELIDDNSNEYKYKYLPKINKPIEFCVDKYTFKLNLPIVKFSLKGNFPNLYSFTDKKYIIDKDFRDINLKLPQTIDILSEPILILNYMQKEFVYDRKEDKYVLKEININEKQAYKISAKLLIKTENEDYLKDIGKIYNYPEGILNINYDNSYNMIIKTNYEDIPGFPQIKQEVMKLKNGKFEKLNEEDITLPEDKITISSEKLCYGEEYKILTFYYHDNVRFDLDYEKIIYKPVTPEHPKVKVNSFEMTNDKKNANKFDIKMNILYEPYDVEIFWYLKGNGEIIDGFAINQGANSIYSLEFDANYELVLSTEDLDIEESNKKDVDKLEFEYDGIKSNEFEIINNSIKFSKNHVETDILKVNKFVKKHGDQDCELNKYNHVINNICYNKKTNSYDGCLYFSKKNDPLYKLEKLCKLENFKIIKDKNQYEILLDIKNNIKLIYYKLFDKQGNIIFNKKGFPVFGLTFSNDEKYQKIPNKELFIERNYIYKMICTKNLK